MFFGFAAALVIELLALAEPKLDFHAAVLEIQGEGNEGHAVLHNACVELHDLPLVHQKPARADRIFVKDVAVLIRAYMHAAHKKLAIFNRAEAVLQIDLPGPNGFDLGPGQFDPGLEALKDKIVMKRFAIVGYFFDALLLWQNVSLPFVQEIISQRAANEKNNLLTLSRDYKI